MTNLRRTAGAFFFYILISFMVLMTMSMFFRSIASVSRTLVQALAPAAIVILALLIYAGFAISVPNMLGWSSWIRWLNPVYYGLEALMINEFHGREFACSTFVPAGPGYTNISPLEHICSTVGAVAGSNVVHGDTYIYEAYLYVSSNKWR
jgi:ATP-binding cassette subfamily G (WHITE) protein 2 (PDR)